MLHTQEVSGSSPFTPTKETRMNARFVRVFVLPKYTFDYLLTTFYKLIHPHRIPGKQPQPLISIEMAQLIMVSP